MVVVSLATKKPPLEKTENLTFSLEEFKRETIYLKQQAVYKSYRFLVLLTYCFLCHHINCILVKK